jgi:RNA polymerase primary sigma factor
MSARPKRTIYSLEETPDAQDDEVAAEEAIAVLTSVETEPGRTTDPVRMYMREMGTVELLTREGEIAIAKRIEEGMRDVLHSMACWPTTVPSVLPTMTVLVQANVV